MAKDIYMRPSDNMRMAYEWIKNKLGTQRGAQSDLAKAMGITQDKLNKVFAGTREFSPKELLAVARFLHISVEEVITGDSPKEARQDVTLKCDDMEKSTGNKTGSKKVLLSIEVV